MNSNSLRAHPHFARLWERLSALVLTTFFMSGCTSLSLSVPGPLIESPEVSTAEGKISVGLGVDDAARFTYIADASARPPNLNNAEVETSQYLFGRGGYGINEWLEIGARIIPGDAKNLFIGGAGVTARAQVYGSGPEPGFKVSVYGGVLGVRTDASGDQNGIFGPGGHNWDARAQAVVSTVGTSVGYRFSPTGALLYVAGSYADQKVSGSIDHDLSSDGLSPAASYTLGEIRGNTRTAALGLRIGEKVQFGFEARAVNRSWPGLSTPETRGGGESTEGVYTLSVNFR